MDYEWFIEKFNTRDTLSHHLGITLLTVGEGVATASLALSDNTRNFMGALHGGALYTLADIVAGCSVTYHGFAPVTLDADVRYLKPIRGGSAMAKATEIKPGRTVCVIRVDIVDDEGNLCVTCGVTMFLTDTPVSAFMN